MNSYINNNLKALIINFFLILSSVIIIQAQEDEIYPLEDEIYYEHIKSVKFHHSSLPTSYPLIDLNSSGVLHLSFDDIEGGTKDYVYSIIHCDKSWLPTKLDPFQYMNGFGEEDISNYAFSSQTIHDYTHYELIIPNKLTSWNISGNYILKVMDEDDDNALILTKRFLVLDSKVGIDAEILTPFSSENYNTHQRVDFRINLNEFYISDPINEISVTILQNNRWDNAISGIKPQTALGEFLNFNKFNTTSFPAGKEYRYFDFRDIQTNSDRTAAIEINTNRLDLYLKRDLKREFKTYIFYKEGNGTFVPNYQGSVKNGKATSEYANVYFELESDHPIYDHDLFVVGEFSSWKLYPENQMHYNEEKKVYEANLLLKQGYYNYLYATINDNNEVSYQATEGDWFEAENDYTILVYYSKLGSRYDQLIGISNISSTQNN